MSSKCKILISVTNTHWIHKSVDHCEQLMLLDGRYRTVIIKPTHKPYEDNLQRIVNDFVEGDYDFWLNMDSDNPPIKNPLDLVDLDRDIIGLPTPIWHFNGKHFGDRPIYFNAYSYDENSKAYREFLPQFGLQQVDAVGTGCVLFARRVFEYSDLRYGAFQRTWNIDGTMNKGNDIAFCERARQVGFEIYAHFDYQCDHFTELSLLEVSRAFREMYEGVNNG